MTYTIDIVKKKFEERGYELLSNKYINNRQKLEYYCLKHKDKGILTITLANFVKGEGCPYCANRIKKTQEEYAEELKKKKPTIICIDEYKNLKTKILHKCTKCGYEWKVRPNNLLYNKNGCPKCANHASLTQKDLENRIQKIDPDIEVFDNYKNTYTKIKFHCKKCDNIWLAKPNNILNGRGCPFCKISKGEKEVEKYLIKYEIEYIKQKTFEKCENINPLLFDFYLPKYNVCIEYDGVQHFEPCTFGGISKEQAKKNFLELIIHDKMKDSFCQKNYIKLIRIPYYKYKTIEQTIILLIS